MGDDLVFAGVDEHQHPTKAVCFFEETSAMCESFFATLKCELSERETYSTLSEARLSIFTFIEGWYNPDRLHSAIGYRSPMQYEQEYHSEEHSTPEESPTPVAA